MLFKEKVYGQTTKDRQGPITIFFRETHFHSFTTQTKPCSECVKAAVDVCNLEEQKRVEIWCEKNKPTAANTPGTGKLSAV